MTIRLSTKEKVVAGVAFGVVAVNMLMATSFVLYLRRGMALLARADVVLPVAAGAKETDDMASDLITLTLQVDRTVLADDRVMTADAVFAMLDAKAPAKVKLRASSRLHYDQLKVFFKSLQEHHVENVTFSVVEER